MFLDIQLYIYNLCRGTFSIIHSSIANSLYEQNTGKNIIKF